jgi:hypothetical protein
MGGQSDESPNFKNCGTSDLGVPRKMSFGCSLVVNHKTYFKGGRWWLPPILDCGEFCKFIYAHGSFVHQKCCNYALINLLYKLCRLIWIIYMLIICPSPHPKAPTCLFYLWSVMSEGMYPTFFFWLFSFWNSHLNVSKSLGVFTFFLFWTFLKSMNYVFHVYSLLWLRTPTSSVLS